MEAVMQYEEYFRHMVRNHPNLAMGVGGPLRDDIGRYLEHFTSHKDWWGVGVERVYWRAWGRTATLTFGQNFNEDEVVQWLCRQANHEARVIEDAL